MSENPLPISNINDFIFCPVSIYFHSLDYGTEKITYQDECQINGTAAHEKIDMNKYSNKKSVLQAVPVYTEKYGLYGKIDLLDCESEILTERKKHISILYDGYIFQLYAQYFALLEMGYTVNNIRLYSLDDNKVYNVDLPYKNEKMFASFEKTISDIQNFDFDNFKQNNPLKCNKCIYEPLCSFSCNRQGITI